MGTGTHEREALLEKIRKLMRVTCERGATENEAAVAAAHVRRLLDSHQIAVVELAEREGRKPTIDVVQRDAGTRGNAAWQRLVARELAKMYDARLLIVGRNLAFYGDPTDVATAAEVYVFIARQVKRLRNQHLAKLEAEGRYQKGAGNEFAFGCAERVAVKLREAAAMRVAPSACTALVVVKTQALDAWAKQQGFKMARVSQITVTGNRAAGYAAGAGVRIGNELGSGSTALVRRSS